MDAWSYQGIELQSGEDPLALFERICRLEAALGLSVLFQAIGTFRASMSKADPPRFNPKGQPRRFLHIAWERDSGNAWSVVLHVAERERRALLSSFTGAGFLSKDIDFRDGHPREAILLTAFNANAEDFYEPVRTAGDADPADRAAVWSQRAREETEALIRERVDPQIAARAARLLEEHNVRFEHGWYLSSGEWRSRYLVQDGSSMAMAAAQESLCTCASRRPETLQLMMPSNGCVHHLVAKMAERIAGSAFAASAVR